MAPLSFQFLPGDNGIYQTVGKIKEAINFSLREPHQLVRKRVESLIRGFPDRDEATEIKTLAGFTKAHFHYLRDPHNLEYLKSPEVIDKEIDSYGEFIGDCDDASAYLAALLKSAGYPVRLSIISPASNTKGSFTHIYTEVYSTKLRRWIPLDMTAKSKPLGWQADANRKQSFDV